MDEVLAITAMQTRPYWWSARGLGGKQIVHEESRQKITKLMGSVRKIQERKEMPMGRRT